MRTWWHRVGDTPAAGIHKVVMGEVGNFPELAQFYDAEVLQPANRLFSATIQRGIDRGEFRRLPVHEVTHALLAPMLLLALHKHAFGACPMIDAAGGLADPAHLLGTHLELVLRGLQKPVAAPAPRRARTSTRGAS